MKMKKRISAKKGLSRIEVLTLIIVLTFVITASAAVLPCFNKAKASALITLCANQIRQIGQAMQNYATDNDDWLPWYGGLTNGVPDANKDESTLHIYTVYRNSHSGNDSVYQDVTKPCACGLMGKPRPIRLACLFEGAYINDGKLFYCPANENLNYRYESYCLSQQGSTQWGAPHQVFNQSGDNDWIRVGYDYYPIDKNIVVAPPFTGLTRMEDTYVAKVTCKKFTNLSQTAPYLSDMLWSKGDISHKSGMKKEKTYPYKVTLYSPGINCLFNDGHVQYIKDMEVALIYYPTLKQRLFDNRIWDKWQNQTSIRQQYLDFNLFYLIGQYK